MNKLPTFLNQVTAPIIGILSFITVLYGFIQVWQGNTGLIAGITLFVGIAFLWLTCLYFARFWKPESEDRSPAGLVDSDESIQSQRAKENQRKIVRFGAKISAFIIPLLTLFAVLGFFVWQNLPVKSTIILLANFDDPEAQNHHVTDTIFGNLEPLATKYPDLKVERLDKIIKSSAEARTEGEQKKATIVIWGWYGKTEQVVLVSANFEIFQPPEHFPELKQEVNKRVQIRPVEELTQARIQTRLSEEVNYLSLFTVGIARYTVEDWDGAIAQINILPLWLRNLFLSV